MIGNFHSFGIEASFKLVFPDSTSSNFSTTFHGVCLGYWHKEQISCSSVRPLVLSFQLGAIWTSVSCCITMVVEMSNLRASLLLTWRSRDGLWDWINTYGFFSLIFSSMINLKVIFLERKQVQFLDWGT